MIWRNIAANVVKGKKTRVGNTPTVEAVAVEYWRGTRFNGVDSIPEIVVRGVFYRQ